MKLRERRVLLTAIAVALAAVSTRVAMGGLQTFSRHKDDTLTSMTSVHYNEQLVNLMGTMRAQLRRYELRDTGRRATLEATNSTAAAAELARLLGGAVANDSSASLTITPERDSTTLADLGRTALRVRFEATTEGLVDFLTSVVEGPRLVRIDALRITARPSAPPSQARLSIEATASAWFRQEHR